MKTIILSAFALALSLSAQANVKDAFNEISRQTKGPFGLNVLQGTSSRVNVNSGGAPKGFLFQAAYRNDVARRAAEQYGFYTANLFTTNYYELMGEYVYGNAYGSHSLDHKSLIARGSQSISKANLMVQNWVLEKHFTKHFPDSKLARSFLLRGVADAQNEQTFANYFFNYYLSSMNSDFHYLPAFLLATKSPIAEVAALDRARDIIATAYDYFKDRLGSNHPMSVALYRLRNAVHNQLSRDVIRQIDEFDRNFPQYRREGHTYVFEVRKILVAYYSNSADKISAQAAKLRFGDIKAAADKIKAQGATPANLLELSRIAADWRTNIGDSAWIEDEKRAQAMALLVNLAQYLNLELSETKQPNNPAILEAVVNTVYLEGFLIKDNWEYFAADARSTRDGATLMMDIIEIAAGGEGSTLYESFSPAYKQWVSVESKMQYFMDNTIKSSALNTAAMIAEKLKR